MVDMIHFQNENNNWFRCILVPIDTVGKFGCRFLLKTKSVLEITEMFVTWWNRTRRTELNETDYEKTSSRKTFLAWQRGKALRFINDLVEKQWSFWIG